MTEDQWAGLGCVFLDEVRARIRMGENMQIPFHVVVGFVWKTRKPKFVAEGAGGLPRETSRKTNKLKTGGNGRPTELTSVGGKEGGMGGMDLFRRDAPHMRFRRGFCVRKQGL